MLASKTPASPAIRRQLEAGLFGSVPIFLGGVFNSIAIAGLGVWRQPLAPFVVWLGIEIFLGMLRLPILVIGRRALKAGKRPPLAMAALLSSAWAASIGFGSALSLTSGDWVLISIVCLSVAATRHRARLAPASLPRRCQEQSRTDSAALRAMVLDRRSGRARARPDCPPVDPPHEVARSLFRLLRSG